MEACHYDLVSKKSSSALAGSNFPSPVLSFVEVILRQGLSILLWLGLFYHERHVRIEFGSLHSNTVIVVL
jgi:hypothetical protein